MLHLLEFLLVLLVFIRKRTLLFGRPLPVACLTEVKIGAHKPFKDMEKGEVKMSFVDKFKVLLKDPLFTKTHFPDVEQPDFTNAFVVHGVILKSIEEPNATLSELFVELHGSSLKGKLDAKTIVSLFIYFYLRDFCDEASECRPRIDSKTEDERLQIFSSVDTNPVNGVPDAMQTFLIRNLSPYDDEHFQNHIFVISNESRSRIKILTQSIQFYKECTSLATTPAPVSPVGDVSDEVMIEAVLSGDISTGMFAEPPSPSPVVASEDTTEEAPAPISLVVEEIIEPAPKKVSFWGVAPVKASSKAVAAQPMPRGVKGSNILGDLATKVMPASGADVVFKKSTPPPSVSSAEILRRAAAASKPPLPPTLSSSSVPAAIPAMIDARRARSAGVG
jgi:hypothetical protein